MVLQLADAEIHAFGAGGFILRDGLLGPSVARAARATAETISGLRRAGIGRTAQLHPELRGDELCWLDRADTPAPLRPVLDLLYAVGVELAQTLWIPMGEPEVQLAHYPGDGARYARHRDAFRGPQSRIVTAIYYLNEDWIPSAGGELRLHLRTGWVDVEPRLDRLVLFLSAELEHEVLPTYASRWAISAWYRGRALPLPRPAGDPHQEG